MFTDSHCHITSKDYEDLNEIIKKATENNITKIINNGTDPYSNAEVLELSKEYSILYPAIGIHPEYANLCKDEDLSYIEKNIENIVAIGEIGLDFHYDDYDKEKQITIFEKQISIAQKYHKPVIIHSRDATDTMIRTLKKYSGINGVIHCFSGSYETAIEFIKLGYKLGIGGVLTFKNSKLKDTVKKIPLDSIILETDSPYLTPEPNRGKKNEPANIIYIAKEICKIKNISLNELSQITEKNIKDLYKI